MSSRLKCKSCGAEFTTDDEFGALAVSCPECGGLKHVPALGDADDREKPGEASAGAEDEEPEAGEGWERAEPEEEPATEPVVEGEEEVELPSSRPEFFLERRGPEPSEPAPEEPVEPAPAGRHRAVVGMFTLVVILAIAFAVIEIYQLGVRALAPEQNLSLHDLGAAVGIPGSSEYVSVETDLNELLVAGVLLIIALRLVVKSKLLEALYVDSDSAGQRTTAGVILQFVVLMAFVTILAGIAAGAKVASARMMAASLGVLLLASAAWLLVTHYVTGRELRETIAWGYNNAIFGLAILVPAAMDMTSVWRFSIVHYAVLALLANSVFAFCIGAGLFFHSDAVKNPIRRVAFVLVGLAVVAGIGALLV